MAHLASLLPCIPADHGSLGPMAATRTSENGYVRGAGCWCTLKAPSCRDHHGLLLLLLLLAGWYCSGGVGGGIVPSTFGSIVPRFSARHSIGYPLWLPRVLVQRLKPKQPRVDREINQGLEGTDRCDAGAATADRSENRDADGLQPESKHADKHEYDISTIFKLAAVRAHVGYPNALPRAASEPQRVQAHDRSYEWQQYQHQ